MGMGNGKRGTGNGERGTGTNYETPAHCNSAYKKRLKAENNSVQAFAESTVTTVYLDLFFLCSQCVFSSSRSLLIPSPPRNGEK